VGERKGSSADLTDEARSGTATAFETGPVAQRVRSSGSHKASGLPGPDFDGVPANRFAPPDTNDSVGATQYLQVVKFRGGVRIQSTQPD